jgi:hypothetical protein
MTRPSHASHIKRSSSGDSAKSKLGHSYDSPSSHVPRRVWRGIAGAVEGDQGLGKAAIPRASHMLRRAIAGSQGRLANIGL